MSKQALYEGLGSILLVLLPVMMLVYTPDLTIRIQGMYGEETTVANQTVRYVAGQDELPNEYTSAEQTHLRDVSFLVKIATAIFIGIITWFLLEQRFPFTKKQLKILSVLLVSVSIFSTVSFSFFFDVFHTVFFEGETYLFPSNYLLVTLFPSSFFEALMRVVVVTWGVTISSLYFFVTVRR